MIYILTQTHHVGVDETETNSYLLLDKSCAKEILYKCIQFYANLFCVVYIFLSLLMCVCPCVSQYICGSSSLGDSVLYFYLGI